MLVSPATAALSKTLGVLAFSSTPSPQMVGRTTGPSANAGSRISGSRGSRCRAPTALSSGNLRASSRCDVMPGYFAFGWFRARHRPIVFVGCRCGAHRIPGQAGSIGPLPTLLRRACAPCRRCPVAKNSWAGCVVSYASFAFGRLAQLEERLPYKEEVGGSSPSAPTHNTAVHKPVLGHPMA